DTMTTTDLIETQAPPVWRVLWTQSHCEQLVHDQLAARGFQSFLPKINVWSKRAGRRHLIRRPMFPGYLFLRPALDKEGDVAARRARGLVAILGDSWESLAAVPEEEMVSVLALSRSDLPSMPYPFLREGARVRIQSGPLAGVEGILKTGHADRGFLVLS